MEATNAELMMAFQHYKELKVAFEDLTIRLKETEARAELAEQRAAAAEAKNLGKNDKKRARCDDKVGVASKRTPVIRVAEKTPNPEAETGNDEAMQASHDEAMQADQNNSISDEEDVIPPPVPAAQKVKIPPIFLRSKASWPALRSEIGRLKITRPVSLDTSDGIRITTATSDDFRALVKLMRDKKYEFHTYQLQEDKGFKVVIRGLMPELSEDYIREDLEAQGFHPISVARMRRGSKRTPMPLVYVNIPREDKALYDITECCNLKVKIESLRPSTSRGQCFRCQMFGHTQSRCTAAPKCVKCGKGHHSDDCEKPRDAPATCANCNGQHTANYRGCVKHPDNARINNRSVPTAQPVRDARPRPTSSDTRAKPRPSTNDTRASRPATQRSAPPRVDTQRTPSQRSYAATTRSSGNPSVNASSTQSTVQTKVLDVNQTLLAIAAQLQHTSQMLFDLINASAKQ